MKIIQRIKSALKIKSVYDNARLSTLTYVMKESMEEYESFIHEINHKPKLKGNKKEQIKYLKKRIIAYIVCLIGDNRYYYGQLMRIASIIRADNRTDKEKIDEIIKLRPGNTNGLTNYELTIMDLDKKL